MSVGSKIRYFRTINNLTQKELASGVCATSYLSKIENDIVEPSDEMKLLFSSKLGLDASELNVESDLLHELHLNAMKLHRTIRKGSKENAIIIYDEIIAKNRTSKDPALQIFKSLFGLRIALMRKNREESIELFEETVGLQEYIPEWMKPYYSRYCGLFHYLYGSLAKSLTLYKEAEKLVSAGECEEIYYQLALVYHLLGEYSMSTFYEEKALELFARMMDYEQCVNCQMLLGINYRKMGDLEKAKETYLSILEKVVPLHNREIIAKVYHNLGVVYSDEGKSTEAVMSFESSLNYRDDDNGRMKTYYSISKEFLKIGDDAIAKDYIKAGEKIAEEMKDEEHIIKYQVLKLKLAKQEHDQVFEHYLATVALPYFEKRSDKESIKEYVNDLVEYYEVSRQYKLALMHLKKIV